MNRNLYAKKSPSFTGGAFLWVDEPVRPLDHAPAYAVRKRVAACLCDATEGVPLSTADRELRDYPFYAVMPRETAIRTRSDSEGKERRR